MKLSLTMVCTGFFLYLQKITFMAHVSILVPAHNTEKYIGSAIESVLAQTFGDWELIVYDDASTDHTLSIARAYERKEHRIKVLSGEAGPWVSTISTNGGFAGGICAVDCSA